MVISRKDINMEASRQIIYNFVLDQIKHKLIKKTSSNVYGLFQRISWLFTGVHSHRSILYTPGSHNAVHVRTIKARFKFHSLMPPYGLSNFISTHDCFASDDYLMKSNITLYAVNLTDAIFLESDENVEVTHSNSGGFMRVGQYKRARKVIVMPFEKFLDFGIKLGKPKCSLVMLPNTGRCGSTLMTQVLESTYKCVAMSEPMALTTICECMDKFDAIQLDRVITSVINVLCKPVDRLIEAYIIKTMANETSLMPYIASLFPEAKILFMYRDRALVTKSFCFLVTEIPMMKTTIKFTLKSRKILHSMLAKSKWPVELLGDFMPQNVTQFLAMNWVFNVHQYLDFRSKGNFQMMAVKYEDIMEDQDYAIRQIMEYCGMEYNEDQVKKAMSKDSQQGSPIGKDVIGNSRVNVPMDEIIRDVNTVCEKCGLLDLPEDYILPGTITHREQ